MRPNLPLACLLLCLISACGSDLVPGEPTAQTQSGFCRIDAVAVESRVDALLAQMSLEEKLAQMHGDPSAPMIAGLWHTADNQRLGIPGFAMVDGPRGVSAATGTATAFPVGMARGATWDPDLEERIGEAIGDETRGKGGSVILAPTAAVLRHPRWGRAQETYGEDPLAIGRMAVGFIRGAQQHVVASVKHFALNSIENSRHRVSVQVDERTLREVYLPHFRMAVQHGHVGSVMSAYNRVNGVYCAENAHLLRDILRQDWGFEGFVESDWILGTRSAAASVHAGLDIEMPVPLFYGDLLVQAIAAGEVQQAEIDESVRRILRTKLCFELDTKPPQNDPARVDTAAHRDLAREAARKSIVLLKNQDQLLPLRAAELRQLVVVGSLAERANIGDLGSSSVAPSSVVTAAAGIRDAAAGVAVSVIGKDVLDEADRAAVHAADAVVVVVGNTNTDEGEFLDRSRLTLSEQQEGLVRDSAVLNARTIVVLEGGSAFLVESWIDSVPALLMAWYPGEEGGTAIGEILFGATNPGAKLPIVFARSADDLPPFDNRALEVTYGYFHGYRLLDHGGREPRFAFGFGLSYTTYRYSNLRLAERTLPSNGTLHVSADITNAGAVAGDEIVQLYVGYPGSRIERPRRDLRGFAKLHLQPGETGSVTIAVPVADLAYYDADGGSWRVESAAYDVFVGASSRDLPLHGSFTVP
jgi:beta-glucosidase